METKKHIRTVVLIALCGMLGACSIHHSKDTPYDPDFPKQTLMDQIPNWDGEALRVCAGHLPKSQRKPHQTGRC